MLSKYMEKTMLKNKFSYYISDAILVIFEGNKNGIFPGENIPFRRGNNSFRRL